MSDGNKQQTAWISNKELFELVNGLRDRIEKTNQNHQSLRVEMEETRSLIRSYNNLNEKMDNVQGELYKFEKQMNRIKYENQGSIKARQRFIEISGWLLAIIMAGYNLFF